MIDSAIREKGRAELARRRAIESGMRIRGISPARVRKLRDAIARTWVGAPARDTEVIEIAEGIAADGIGTPEEIRFDMAAVRARGITAVAREMAAAGIGTVDEIARAIHLAIEAEVIAAPELSPEKTRELRDAIAETWKGPNLVEREEAPEATGAPRSDEPGEGREQRLRGGESPPPGPLAP